MGASVVILEDGVRSQIVEIWDRHWLQNIIPIFDCIEIAFNGDQACFARVITDYLKNVEYSECNGLPTAQTSTQLNTCGISSVVLYMCKSNKRNHIS